MENSDFFNAILKNNIVGVGVVDLNGKYILVNSVWANLFGYTIEEAYHLTIDDVTPFKNIKKTRENLRKLVSGEMKPFRLERQYIRKNGSTFWAAISVAPFLTEDGKIDSIIAFIVNIDDKIKEEKELKIAFKKLQEHNKQISKSNQELEFLARIDPLTELFNRRGIQDEIDKETYRSNRNKTPLLFAMGDLDNFKKINDKFGHDAGDFVLKEVANTIHNVIRETDSAGRWGGEEFLIILLETDAEIGNYILNRIRKRIEDKIFKFNENVIDVTITFGLAEYDSTKDYSECIKRADTALYKGKKGSKNCVVCR